MQKHEKFRTGPRHCVAAVVHVALMSNVTLDDITRIREEIYARHPEVIGFGYHGLKDFDSDYPTQV